MIQAVRNIESADKSGPREWPAMSLSDAHAALTAPGAMFEMEAIELSGRLLRAWKNGPKSLVELFVASATFADRTFLVQDGDRVTFDAFRRATFHFAHALIANGVAKGDRVAIVMRNQVEWPAAFYGAALAGAIVSPLNAWWSPSEIAYALRDSGAKVAVFDEERYARTRGIFASCPDLQAIFVSGLAAPLADGTISLESIIGNPADWGKLPDVGPPPVAVDWRDPATLFYTSGTSGVPKGAIANHRAATTSVLATLLSQFRASLRRSEEFPPMGPDAPQKRFLLAIPLFHVIGCFSLLNLAMATGAMLVILRKWDTEAAMRLIERERVTSVGGVPTIPLQLMAHPARAGYDLSSIEMVSYGGAPASPEIVHRVRSTMPNAATGTGWGMTETSATFTHHVGEDYEHRPESCGPATPVADMKIVDPFGATLPIGSVGELWVRGPHVVESYWNKPEATAESFEDGWLKTGDLARVDTEGFLYIVDRAKDVIIRGGENIYSVEVENVLQLHPAVTDAALVAIPHRMLGEEAGGIVTIKKGAHATEDELKAFVGDRLAAFKIPARILLWDEPLPRNATGKILKTALRRLFAPPISDI